MPSPEELKLLEPFRGQVPDEVFGEPFVPPVSDGSGQDRALLRKAAQLLQDAGLVVKDRKRLLPNGEVFKIEFLLDEPSFQPHHATFIKNLGTLGIEATIRLVDAVQYRARVEDFDFDMTTSASACRRRRATVCGRLHLAGGGHQGIVQSGRDRQSRIDALVDKTIGADTRADLTIACRALDRVFRAGRYWVPHWYRATHPMAYWDVFDHPKTLPRYGSTITGSVGERFCGGTTRNKAAKLEQAK